MMDIDSVQSSFELYIYQVTDTKLCDSLENLAQQGLKLTLLVSKRIYGTTDYYRAKACYEQLHKANIVVRTAWSFDFSFYNHQKFWIIDGARVTLSTGNWSPSDYPSTNSTSYPPHHNPYWQSINRDFTFSVKNADVVKVFQDVFDHDYSSGTNWSP